MQGLLGQITLIKQIFERLKDADGGLELSAQECQALKALEEILVIEPTYVTIRSQANPECLVSFGGTIVNAPDGGESKRGYWGIINSQVAHYYGEDLRDNRYIWSQVLISKRHAIDLHEQLSVILKANSSTIN